jgi:hypothetical protein
MNKIIKRMNRPTPSFFKKVRNAGLALAAISTAILTAPVALPAILVNLAGYIAVAGGVMSGVSQTAVKMEKK